MKKGIEKIIKVNKVKNPIYEAIMEYIDDFNLKFGETKDTFKKARLATSDRKEQCVTEFFLSFLPNGYRIKRGEIFDYNNISNSIDCVIMTPNHPYLKTPMRPEIIIAEGVYAAIEVKPDISTLSEKGELYRGLKQSQSVKKLTRNISMPNIDRLDLKGKYKKIPFIIFSGKSSDIEKTLEFIDKEVKEGKFTKEDLPDIIFSLDGWLIYHTENIKTSLFYPNFKEEGISNEKENVFMLFKGKVNDIICILLLLLFKFGGPEYIINGYIVNDYLLKLYSENKIQFSRAIWYE